MDWTYTITVSASHGREGTAIPDPGVDAIIAACQDGLSAAGIPPAGTMSAGVEVTQAS